MLFNNKPMGLFKPLKKPKRITNVRVVCHSPAKVEYGDGEKEDWDKFHKDYGKLLKQQKIERQERENRMFIERRKI